MHCISHAPIGLFGHCPEAKTHFTVSNPKHGFNKNPQKTSLSVLSIEHLFIKWSSIRRYSLTYEKVITVLYLKLSPCVCVSGGGRGPGGSESPGSWASRGQGAWVMIGSKGSGDHGAMGIKGMMSVKEHGAWFGVSMEARKVQGPGHLGGRGPG